MASALPLAEAHVLRPLAPSYSPSTEKISNLSRGDTYTLERSYSAPDVTLPPSRVPRLQRLKQSSYVDAKILACYTSLFVAGWSDATAGPSLPSIQVYFGLSYAEVSCIWISQAVGFIIGSFVNVHLISFFGEGTYFAIGAAVQMCCYALVIPALPFPVFCVAWAFLGCAMSGQDALANAYVANLPGAAQKLGFLHALYGLGALLTPLATTAMIDAGIRWSYAYAVALGWAALNLAAVLYGFRLKREPQEIAPAPEVDDSVEMSVSAVETTHASSTDTLKRVLKSKTAMLFSFFLFLYVGTEVSEGGWIVTYLIDERKAGTRAGYVASGFWLGITIGRIVMPQISVRIGEWKAILWLTAITAVFEGLVWAVPDFVAASVFYAISGFTLGTFYPTAISLATKLLPRSMHAAALGFCASFGQAGSAVFPFIIGALAQRFSPSVLQPSLIILCAAMAIIWLIVPRPSRDRSA